MSLGILVAGAAPVTPADASPTAQPPVARLGTEPPRRARLTGGSGNVVYYGGHVISRVQIVAVMWTSGVSQEVSSGIGSFYAAITQSAYFDWLGEYDTVGKSTVDGSPGTAQHVNRGSFLKTVTITPTHSGPSIKDSDIQAELKSQVGGGALPAPVTDPEGGVDTIYMIHFPPGVTIDDGSGTLSCQGWCAYHGSVTLPNVASDVPYAIIPDFSDPTCAQGCSISSAFETATGAASHELGEAVTDAEVGLATGNQPARPLAWLDASNGEIGDICENDPNAFTLLAGFTVQKLWSQRLGACITEDSNLSLCDGTTRPCRPCSAQDDGVACTGATPVCETDVSSPKVGQCVACVSSKECPSADKPVCDSASATCRGCAKDTECGGATPKCHIPAGACVQCVGDTDCPAARPVCDSASRTCRGCRTNADCRAPEVCNVSTGACGEAPGCAPGNCPSNDAGPGAPGPSGGPSANGSSGGGSSDANGPSGCALSPRAPSVRASRAELGGVACGLLALGLLARRRRARRGGPRVYWH